MYCEPVLTELTINIVALCMQKISKLSQCIINCVSLCNDSVFSLQRTHHARIYCSLYLCSKPIDSMNFPASRVTSLCIVRPLIPVIMQMSNYFIKISYCSNVNYVHHFFLTCLSKFTSTTVMHNYLWLK